MARYIIDTNPTSVKQLTEFDLEGYYYSEAQSTPTEPVFLRAEQK
jgi:cytoplasmic iron level regulating protein YaaA (DUF328/UPF0246 family)